VWCCVKCGIMCYEVIDDGCCCLWMCPIVLHIILGFYHELRGESGTTTITHFQETQRNIRCAGGKVEKRS
jgi:hypothetical protein